MESMQLALDNVVSAIFDGSNEIGSGSSEVQLALCRIFEGFLAVLSPHLSPLFILIPYNCVRITLVGLLKDYGYLS